MYFEDRGISGGIRDRKMPVSRPAAGEDGGNHEERFFAQSVHGLRDCGVVVKDVLESKR